MSLIERSGLSVTLVDFVESVIRGLVVGEGGVVIKGGSGVSNGDVSSNQIRSGVLGGVDILIGMNNGRVNIRISIDMLLEEILGLIVGVIQWTMLRMKVLLRTDYNVVCFSHIIHGVNHLVIIGVDRDRLKWNGRDHLRRIHLGKDMMMIGHS